MTAIQSTQGIVAFLDILGYQNFIDNNNVKKAVEILDNVFANLKEAVIEDCNKLWTKSDKGLAIFENVKIQTLSDSIIIHLANSGKTSSWRDWTIVFLTVRIVQRRLFDNGFPSRGAVASGEYFFRDGFLVGLPFMDAYRWTQKLEFAGVV